MSKAEIIKAQLISLLNEINTKNGNEKLKFNQQKVELGNMSLSGANGRLRVTPSNIGYDVSLSGKSLESNLYNRFKELFGCECHGYKQTNRHTGIITQPFWRTDNFSLVREAALIYAKTK